MIALRPYQHEAVEATFAYWAGGGVNPLIEMATGLGKSVIIAEIMRRVIGDYPDMRVLMLVHVRELVEQNFRALLSIWPDAPAGIYSAGLGRRDAHHKITMASIQSVYRKAAALGPRDLVIVDEAHLVPADGAGMYRTLFAALREVRPDLRVAGLTATAFRLDSGRLDKGADRLFTDAVYKYDIGDGIRDGWLAPLISKASVTEIDVSGVVRRGGEFVSGSLEKAADKDEVTQAAAREMIALGEGRRSWIVFCAGVNHAHNVRDALRVLGVAAETVTGETPAGERASLVRRFKAGEIRCLTNAQVLTTGFDAPAVDMIAFLRPTLSTGLYLQMVGRGVRKASGKENCLVLDFAGNVRRHGPVDAVVAPKGRAKQDDDDDQPVKVGIDTVRAKTCPGCEALVSLACYECPHCGHQWPIPQEKPKHAATADNTPILSTERPAAPELLPVVSWSAAVHSKEGSPDSLRVTYQAGLMSYREWICFEHVGFARQKAVQWWAQHGGGKAPATIAEAIVRFGSLRQPSHILVRADGKFFKVVSRRFSGEQAA